MSWGRRRNNLSNNLRRSEISQPQDGHYIASVYIYEFTNRCITKYEHVTVEIAATETHSGKYRYTMLKLQRTVNI